MMPGHQFDICRVVGEYETISYHIDSFRLRITQAPNVGIYEDTR